MKLSTSLVLALLYFSKIFKVDYDTSHMSIGGVLSQNGYSLVSFSKKFNDIRKNYYIECYAIVQALRHWRHDPKRIYLS